MERVERRRMQNVREYIGTETCIVGVREMLNWLVSRPMRHKGTKGRETETNRK